MIAGETRAGLLAAALLLGCAAHPGALRFHNQPTHWRVADERPIAQPKPTPDWFRLYHFDNKVARPIDLALRVPAPTRARDINALGEVPDSTWFTNRIGVRDVPVDELRTGGNAEPPRAPLRITKLKPDREGFSVEDAAGRRWLVKLDPPALPELGTGAGIVSQRLLRAIGYHVPDDHIVRLRADELELADDATITVAGRKTAVAWHDIEALLAAQPRDRDGRVRAIASRMLDGEPLGTFDDLGRRRDDPNDRVPHEHRRVLRGLYVFAAWLSHSDLNPGNRLDMWIPEPGTPERGHVVHYLIDLDRTLGAMAVVTRTWWDSYEHSIDYKVIATSLVTFGLWKRPWEGLPRSQLRGVGRFDSAHFTATGFHPRVYFMPFVHKDELDGFWAAKILVRLRPEHIRAAVEAAEYSDPRSVAYLTTTLIERQRILARYWFRVVNPLDELRVVERGQQVSLCGVDLLLRHGLDDVAVATRYDARAWDRRGRVLPLRRRAAAGKGGEFCVADLPIAKDGDRYTIVGVRTWRGRRVHPPVFVHVAAAPSGGLRIIGIDRRPGPARRHPRGRS